MLRRMTLLVATFAAVALGARHTFAADPETDAALYGIDYIRSLQNVDGGFPAFGSTSDAGGTIDATFAFTAAGIDPKTVTSGGNGPDDYLATQAASYSGTPGGAAKLVLAVIAMDLDPTSFGGINPTAVMQSNYDAVTGQYGTDTFAQSLYIMARAAAGASVPPEAVSYLQSLQQIDGGWEYCCGFGGDTNSTAIALRALIAGGAAGDMGVANGLAYLAANENSDGGFGYCCGGGSDPNSTAFVLQALVAAGEDIDPGGPWDAGSGAVPLKALAGFQNQSTGALQYFGSDSAYATYQGVPGLMLAPYPESADPDADGLAYAADNCPSVANPGQLNSDANFIDLSPPKVYDDLTWVNSDGRGDACEDDDDNDGLTDAQEAGVPCGSATAPTDPTERDTDGDLTLDGAECAFGTNPNSPISVPGTVLPDSDSDQLPNAFEASLGTDPLDPDTDGDRILDGVEFRHYWSDPLSLNTDGDACGDGREVASINQDKLVTSADLSQVAQSFGSFNSGKYIADFDVNKDGDITSSDLSFVAQHFGSCP